jgi:hypothetical protein
MFKFILCNLLIIIPYIFGIKEASIYDLTTDNNKFGKPMITSTSKNQRGCGVCGYFTISRQLEYWKSYHDWISNDNDPSKIVNYDFSLDFLILQTAKIQLMNTIACGDDERTYPSTLPGACNDGVIMDTLINIGIYCNSYIGKGPACFIESKWCPFMYGNLKTLETDIVEISDICEKTNDEYNNKNVISVNIPLIGNNNIKDSTAFVNTLISIETNNDIKIYPYSISIYMPNCTNLSTNKQIITFDLLNSFGDNCKIPSEKLFSTNHVVTLVGIGIENGMRYLKLLNSYGSSWGDNGFFYVQIVPESSTQYGGRYGVRGILNTYIKGTVYIENPIMPTSP